MKEKEWEKRLTKERYKILREKGTEKAFTGKLLNNKEKGNYACAGCGNVLFESDKKFDSGSGWPSFYDAKKGAVEFKKDPTLGMERIEAVCAKCKCHLGHVFDDAPQMPTGKRYCINSLALKFKKEKIKRGKGKGKNR